MKSLRFCAAQIDCKLNRGNHVLGMGIYTDRFGTGIGVHLPGGAVQCIFGKSGCSQVITQNVLDTFVVPGTGKNSVDGSVPQAGHSGTVRIHNKMGIMDQVDQVICDFDRIIAAEVHPLFFPGAVAEHRAAVSEIKGRQIPAVCKGK